jgi:hypothetical protein
MSTIKNQIFIDPDTDLSRLRRAFNQFDGENLFLKKSASYSLQERLLKIREFVFKDFTNVWGQDKKKIIAEGYTHGWPDKNLIYNHYWPDFQKKIDTLNNEIATLPPSKKEVVALRLSVLVYFLGIILHPSVDGNGQSFRILALSYIREHSKQYANSFFPIKYVQDYGMSIGIYPVTEHLLQNIIEILHLEKNEWDEGVLKEKILTTLLKTEKGDAFLREYLHGKLKLDAKNEDPYVQTRFAFKKSFDSLERDFQALLEKENEETRKEKHLAIQKILKDYSVSLKDNFIFSKREKESITNILRSF